jgi:proton-dependent oligopeptide transporter, POT family
MIGEYWDEWSHSKFWFVLAMLAFGMALVLFALLKPLKRAMPGV